jgi:hypothetical protein
MDFLYGVPALVLLLLAVVIAVAIVGAGQVYIHNRFHTADFASHHQVGGVIIQISGTIYAVILGFVTVVAWQHFVEARNLVVRESNAAVSAWHTAIGLPSPLRERLRSDMLSYARTMVDSEWPLMRHGAFDRGVFRLTLDSIDATARAQPTNAAEANALNWTMQQLLVLHGAREERIAINGSGISWFEWLVLLIGAASIICFCWLFQSGKARIRLLMTSVFVTLVVSLLVLLFELQYPFRSDIGIAADAWRNIIAHIHEVEADEH